MKHRMFVLLSLLFGAAACGPIGHPDSPVSANYALLAPCKRPDKAGLSGIYAESLCGTISVLEDRSKPSGRRIDLNVMLIRATDPGVKPDPIFFLAGGPGQAATGVGPQLFTNLREIRRERDVVLVDQRGTGKSNPFDCNLGGDGIDQLGTDLDELTRMQTAALNDCLADFDGDPAQYTTPVAMDDLDEVRRVLGYDRINLYGGSYGTRAALVYLRRHESTVRSVVLDSVVPLTMSIPANVAIDAQSAFDKLLADCRADTGCAASFPDLAPEFKNLIKRLELAPEEIVLEHPRTGVRLEGRVEARLISRLIRAALYDRNLSQLLPLAIHEAFNYNYQPIMTLGYAFTGDADALNMGMMVSVLCSEDMKLADGPNDADDFDNPIYHSLAPVCRFWPIGDIPARYFEPVTSDIPVLLISGQIDPITPPKYGIEAAASLPNSTHVIVPGVGHGASLRGCLPDVVGAFIDDPESHSLNTSCAADLKRPPFFTSFAGTALAGDTGND